MAVRAEPPVMGRPGPRDGYPTAAERPERSDGPGTRGTGGHEGGASGSCRWGRAWPGALVAQEE